MAKINDLQCTGDALFQSDVKVNGKMNNEVLDVDDNCLIIDVCRRLDLSTVGNKIEVAIPDGYVGDARSAGNYPATIQWSTQGTDRNSWATNATINAKFIQANTDTEVVSSDYQISNASQGVMTYSEIQLPPFIKSYIKIEVKTTCTGATKPYVMFNCRIYCHKE